MELQITDGWRKSYPGAHAGILALENVANPPENGALAEQVRTLEAELRARWGGANRADLAHLPEFEAYRNYYRRFDKTYHVQLQFESVVLKNKPLRSNGALVLAMFAAELANRLLTAGHDLDRVEGPVAIGVAEGGERYVGIGGRELSVQRGDMFMQDQSGIISDVLYGPDDRTQLTESTRRALFCVYAPAGITPEAVQNHLCDIARYVQLIAPGAAILHQRVYPA